MNTGLLSSRYAEALLKYAEASGCGSQICEQAEKLLYALYELPSFSAALDNHGVEREKKMALIEAAFAPDESLCGELRRFFFLLLDNERMSLLKFILHSFIDKYYVFSGVKYVVLRTVRRDEALEKRIVELLRQDFGLEARIVNKIDEGLIGGFVLEMDGRRVDASVSGKLERMREEFRKATENKMSMFQ